mmetsp:Transcript_45382/g.98467  ORF Transcript_45382/g.98467 Transcript_45382/m.98467 type:complete len:228 (+) Transcript_45382:45-728(+)
MGNKGSTEAKDGSAPPPPADMGPPPTEPTGKFVNKVQLAASVLGGVPPMCAYHTSVLINDEEFFFDMGGVMSTRNLGSHEQMKQQSGKEPVVIDMGYSQYTASQLKSALDQYFLAGSYDLLRKNCNSFSDCALFYLLRVRIDSKYRNMEKLGAANASMFQSMSNGQYEPNAKADGFSVEEVISKVDPEKAWSTPGQQTGGETVSSVEEMRRKRLEALERRQQAQAAA